LLADAVLDFGKSLSIEEIIKLIGSIEIVDLSEMASRIFKPDQANVIIYGNPVAPTENEIRSELEKIRVHKRGA